MTTAAPSRMLSNSDPAARQRPGSWAIPRKGTAVDDATAAEFWSFVDKRGDDECWLWQGPTDKKGYGVFWRRPRKEVLAHRRMMRLVHGDIPDGMCVCHSCDVPLCVNPAHLWFGTKRENTADRDRKLRQARGEQNKGGGKLTSAQVLEIRALIAAGHKRCGIAAAYGISDGMVGHIKHGRAWRHVI